MKRIYCFYITEEIKTYSISLKDHYPLLENMEIKEKYATKAMDYYRQLLRAKAYDEKQPNMPGKKKAYTSIFQKKESPVKEQKPKHKNIRECRTIETDGRNNEDDDFGNFLRSTFFGDDLFNRNKRKIEKEEEREREREREEEREDEKEEENNLKADPADLNKKETDEIDDAGMKIEKRKNSLEEKKEEQERIAYINAQAQVMQQRASTFLGSDPEGQASMINDAQRVVNAQQ